MPPTVAIVILNWNGRKVLEQFLPSVVRTGYAAHTVYVADNASTDDSIPWLQQHYPQVKLIAMDENRGYAGGYNKALQQVEADYFVLLNSDVEVDAGWLEPMVQLLESDPDIAACQPRVRAYLQRDHFEYAGAAGGWIDKFGYPFCRGRVFDHIEKDLNQYTDTRPVFWATGAALFVRANAFKKVGGLDEYFFAHQEEIDLCWRLQLAGYHIYVCGDSLVYHLGGGTLPQGSPRKTYLNFRNNLIMLWKNLPWQQRCWKMPIRFTLDAVVAWKELFKGNGATFKAVVKAHFGFCNWWWFHQKKKRFPGQ
ncbi:MAG: glycosyltransferase family 2 protein [Chitinophagaceae bacterium]|nr:glycosyltransferase family 2 protein [Chitinophagaceae bacterium]